MLNIADIKYNNLISTINTEGEWDTGEKVRGVYESDDSPSYTKSIFGHQVKFKNGEIPLITSKKVFVLTAIKEAWLFWIKQTVQEKDFHDNNIKIWNQWFKDGSLGRSYAYQFESHRHHNREIIKVSPRVKENTGKIQDMVINKLKHPNLSNDNDFIGGFYETKNYGSLVVLESVKETGERTKYRVQFIKTGYITIAAKNDIIRGEVKDYYHRNVAGVGYRGNYLSVKNYTKEEVDILYKSWKSMLTRCYGSIERPSYQGKEIYVDERWHSFENFLRDVRYLPQFFLAKEDGFKGWQLDKDYYVSNCYSVDTCVWLSKYDNLLYRDYIKPFYAINSNGDKKIFISQRECADYLGLKDKSAIGGCLNKKPNRNTAAGHTFEYIDDGSIYRYELSKNQVVDLLLNIKNNPQSRRLMTSFWNHADVDKKQLQECAWSTQWNIKKSYLDLILIQRSVDTGLGLPFNWIQYWLIGKIIAHVNGLQLRDFTHQMGNAHYYDRHEASLLEQIESPTFNTPIISINSELQDFFDFTPGDMTVDFYECGKYVPLEVSI